MSGGPRRRVLLVEDSEAVRDAYSMLLEESGYEVVTAADGSAALAAAAASTPDILLLDLGLPGMDGHQVIRALKASSATASIPILALTGTDDPAVRQACLEAGCAEYLIKPFPTQQLLRLLGDHLA